MSELQSGDRSQVGFRTTNVGSGEKPLQREHSRSSIIFSGSVSRGNTAKIRPFSLISGATQQSFSAVQTVWRREVDSNSQSGFKLLGKVLFVSDRSEEHTS